MRPYIDMMGMIGELLADNSLEAQTLLSLLQTEVGFELYAAYDLAEAYLASRS